MVAPWQNPVAVRSQVDDISDLELALLRRGMLERSAVLKRCGGCRRVPLIGERVYVYDHEAIRCELCRGRERRPPVASYVIHGPEFGHTMRIADRRAA